MGQRSRTRRNAETRKEKLLSSANGGYDCQLIFWNSIRATAQDNIAARLSINRPRKLKAS